jgi:hypothetical protein
MLKDDLERISEKLDPQTANLSALALDLSYSRSHVSCVVRGVDGCSDEFVEDLARTIGEDEGQVREYLDTVRADYLSRASMSLPESAL